MNCTTTLAFLEGEIDCLTIEVRAEPRCTTSHVAQVIRRFRRVCAAVGSESNVLLVQVVTFTLRRQALSVCIMQCHNIKARAAHEEYLRHRCESGLA